MPVEERKERKETHAGTLELKQVNRTGPGGSFITNAFAKKLIIMCLEERHG